MIERKPPWQTPTSGVALTPQYEQLHFLGKGQNSTVCLVRHISGNMMAVKTLNATPGSESCEQALRELRLLSKHNSPHLTHMFEAFHADGRFHLVLEWMAAGSLDQLVALDQPGVPPDALAAVMAQLICGLVYLHRDCQQIHRDIKPANALVDVSGVVKLSDFGIATDALCTASASRSTNGGASIGSTSSKQAHSFVGTAAYMAPERIQGASYTFSADIWSLGVVAVECAQARHPLRDSASYYEMVASITSGAPPTLRRPESYPIALSAFVSSCLRSTPKERLSCEQLIAHEFLKPFSAPVAATAESVVPAALIATRAWLTSIGVPLTKEKVLLKLGIEDDEGERMLPLDPSATLLAKPSLERGAHHSNRGEFCSSAASISRSPSGGVALARIATLFVRTVVSASFNDYPTQNSSLGAPCSSNTGAPKAFHAAGDSPTRSVPKRSFRKGSHGSPPESLCSGQVSASNGGGSVGLSIHDWRVSLRAFETTQRLICAALLPRYGATVADQIVATEWAAEVPVDLQSTASTHYLSSLLELGDLCSAQVAGGGADASAIAGFLVHLFHKVTGPQDIRKGESVGCGHE